MARKSPASASIGGIRVTLPIGGDLTQSAGAGAGYEAQHAAVGGVQLVAPSHTHVNVQLGPKAARALLRIREGLRATGATLPDGRPVFTTADALRFLLETCADAAAESARDS
jgi:hypothetical protein